MNNGFYEPFHFIFSAASILGTMPFKYNQVDIMPQDKTIVTSKTWTKGRRKSWRKKINILWILSIIMTCATSMYLLVVLLHVVIDESEVLMQRKMAMESSLFFQITAFTLAMSINFIHCSRTFHEVPKILSKLRFLEEYAVAKCLYEENDLKKLRKNEKLAGQILAVTLLVLTILPPLVASQALCKSLAFTGLTGIVTFTFYEAVRIPQFSLDVQMWLLFYYVGNRCKLLNHTLNEISEQIRQSKERPPKEDPYNVPILRSGKQQSVYFDVECDSSFTICKKKTRRYYPVVCATMRHMNCVHRGLSLQLQESFNLYQLPILLLVLLSVHSIGSALFTLLIVSSWDMAVHEVGSVANNVVRLAVVFIPLSLTAQKVGAALKYLSLINNSCLPPDCTYEVQLFSRRVLKAPLKFVACRFFKCTLSFLGRMSLGLISYLLIMLQYNKAVSR